MKYFMSYLWRQPFFSSDWKHAMKGTNEHPIDAIIRMQKAGQEKAAPTTESYILLSWQVVNPDEVKTEEWWDHTN